MANQNWKNWKKPQGDEIKFEILELIGCLSETNEKGYTREVNIVSWNEADPKVDIRSWDADHKKMSKGITLTIDEARLLVEYLCKALE